MLGYKHFSSMGLNCHQTRSGVGSLFPNLTLEIRHKENTHISILGCTNISAMMPLTRPEMRGEKGSDSAV